MRTKIKQKPDVPEIPVEIIAQDIQQLTHIGNQFKVSRLNERAQLVLLQAMTGLPQKTIKTILDALPKLAREYLR